MPYLKIILSFTALIFLTYQFSFGQNRPLSDDDLNHSTGSKIRFADTITCDGIKEWIKSDIKNNTIFLFLEGGIAPVVYTTDKEFENKYRIYFYDFGDTPPDNKCLIKYNDMVFDYLTTVYGKKWIKEIRKDVIGLSNWKRHNK